MGDFMYRPMITHQEDKTNYECISNKHIKLLEFNGKEILAVEEEGLRLLAYQAFNDMAFFQRSSHLEKVAKIISDKETSDNDRFVAETLLRSAATSAKGELPFCQDTGTAIVIGHKGQQVWTGFSDEAPIARGIYDIYTEKNLRYSQIIPYSMFDEKNSGTNLPPQFDIYATTGMEYKFLFIAKGGGSANKTYLFQETKSLLNESSFSGFLKEKIKLLGTAACPPYHIALVVGGTSVEANLKAVKLASAGYYDDLPQWGSETGSAFRDILWEEKILRIASESGIGAQFGGKYLAHDVRVIRMPRHAASCPVGMGVSCSADRNIKAKISKEGIFLEKLEKDPKKYLPQERINLKPPVKIDLNMPMDKIREQLSRYPVKTRLSLTGTLIVARDSAHAGINEILQNGGEMPEYFKNHPVYYAGPAKQPAGKPSGSFGPTTAQRMDIYVEEFMAKGGSFVMVAKGNRSDSVTQACEKHKGFYLGSIGGPAALLADEHIKSVELIDFDDLGMEAVRKIEVEDFPAFIICDDKGNNFFTDVIK
ncbi:MAG: fumarate hydratase [bacterium]|nr:fumarate hydratase [bacterium]